MTTRAAGRARAKRTGPNGAPRARRRAAAGSRAAARPRPARAVSRTAAARPAPAATFPLRAVTALFFERQHLDRPRGIALNAENLSRFVEDTGGLQLDSINVLDRAHYLTAWNRFGPYDRAAFDALCYEKRVLFEYWAHAACLVATTQLGSWRRAMAEFQVRHTGWSAWLRKNSRLMRAVEDSIRERGPLGNADFVQRRPGGSGWWSWKPTTHALHYLWMTGRIMVDSRVHFQKRFHLTERVLDGVEVAPMPSAEEFQRWHVERSLHAMGAATEADLRMYLTFPRMGRGVRDRALAAMLKDGAAVEIAIEDDRARWFALARDLPALERAAAKPALSRGTALLAPFDSLMWYRERVARLFGFDYRIEVYTPGHKRVHGYYTLPILHDGRLIGRLDAKNHRDRKRLEARHLHFERWFADGRPAPGADPAPVDRARAFAGLAETLESLATFLGAERVELKRVSPSRLAPAVRAALRESRAAAAAPEPP